MSTKTYIPSGYSSCLGLYDTQKAIGLLNNTFQIKLCAALHLKRVTAPLFVDAASGLNDNLSGIERPVSFDVPAGGYKAEVVHSLAKWKRMALADYGFRPGNGLLTNMNAIRRDEEMDNLHSIYVDQWDWEKIITCDERCRETLENTVRRIVDAICNTLEELKWEFTALDTQLVRDVTFITSEELLAKYPKLTAKERENAICKEYGTVFIIGIGGLLSNGEPHDGRAPDYDDWGLNGDLLFWHEGLARAIEISSMGIRVDEASLAHQLKLAHCENRAELPFHKRLLSGELPLTIGGGIGQSRLCMLLLGKIHVGEVQVSLWDEETRNSCANAGVELL
ncbi:MAG: aspartate--ammonia ligase [Oscillospiraceae bacterium]